MPPSSSTNDLFSRVDAALEQYVKHFSYLLYCVCVPVCACVCHCTSNPCMTQLLWQKPFSNFDEKAVPRTEVCALTLQPGGEERAEGTRVREAEKQPA